VCHWCRRMGVDDRRSQCNGPTPPRASRKRRRPDDAQWSRRSEAARPTDFSMVRLLAAAGQWLAGGWRDSDSTVFGTVAPLHSAEGPPLEGVEWSEPPLPEAWDAFSTNPDTAQPEGMVSLP